MDGTNKANSANGLTRGEAATIMQSSMYNTQNNFLLIAITLLFTVISGLIGKLFVGGSVSGLFVAIIFGLYIATFILVILIVSQVMIAKQRKIFFELITNRKSPREAIDDFYPQIDEMLEAWEKKDKDSEK